MKDKLGLILGSIMLDINASTNNSLMLSEQSGNISITLGGGVFNIYCNLIATGFENFVFYSRLKDQSFLSKMIMSKISDMHLKDVEIDMIKNTNESVCLSFRNTNDSSLVISSSSFADANIDVKTIENKYKNIRHLVIDLNLNIESMRNILRWTYLNGITSYCLLTSKENVNKLAMINSEIIPNYTIGRNKEVVELTKDTNIFKNTTLLYVSNQNGWKVINKGKTIFTLSDFNSDDSPQKTSGISSLLATSLIVKNINRYNWDQMAEFYMRYYPLLQKYPGANLLTQDVNKVLCYSFFKDQLTGLLTRSALTDNIAEMMDDSSIRTVGLILCDIDHFKSVNDKYGHDTGDETLRFVAGKIKSRLRSNDFAYRFGGEEFLCIIPNTNEDLLLSIAERLRIEISNELIEYNGHKFNITISAGISVYNKSNFVFDIAYKETDKKLYLAKNLGRNRVISQLTAGAMSKK